MAFGDATRGDIARKRFVRIPVGDTQELTTVEPEFTAKVLWNDITNRHERVENGIEGAKTRFLTNAFDPNTKDMVILEGPFTLYCLLEKLQADKKDVVRIKRNSATKYDIEVIRQLNEEEWKTLKGLPLHELKDVWGLSEANDLSPRDPGPDFSEQGDAAKLPF